ncbi:MAG: hypothetical protein IT324_19530 [Anaerolineae bacterium]|nr:hypothetical protein [Anaerolineae bacterium]
MNEQALANDMVDAIWTLVKVKAYARHGERMTLDELLAVARETADLVSAFLDKQQMADSLFALMQEGLIEASAQHGGMVPPSAFFH